MKKNEIQSLFTQFEAAASAYEGVECWSARELQPLLGYSKWENFAKVIQKAKESCANAGQQIGDHFPEVRKMVSIGSGAEKEIHDILLTRPQNTTGTVLKRSLWYFSSTPATL